MTVTSQTPTVTDPSVRLLPHREPVPRVRLRVRVALDVLEAAVVGLERLDDHRARVLTEAVLAGAPPVPASTVPVPVVTRRG